MYCVENEGWRVGVLGAFRSVAAQDGLSDRIYGSLRLFNAIQSGLGGIRNGCVVFTSGFIDDRLKRAL